MSLNDKVSYKKKPINFEEQVSFLEQKGLIIENKARALDYLQRIGYYRLKAYAIVFQIKAKDKCFNGTNMEQIIDLYNFDRNLKVLFMEAIESFEISLRSIFANYLSCISGNAFAYVPSEKYGKTEDFFYNIDNKHYQNLRDRLKKSWTNRKKESFVDHFKTKYVEEFPPIWMATEVMSLGDLSLWINLLQSKYKKDLIKKYYKIDSDTFTSFIKGLTEIRNYVAHHARLWNRNIPTQINSNMFKTEEIKKQLNKDRIGGLKIYNYIILLIYFLKQVNSPVKFAEQLKSIIEKYDIDTSKMGFPKNWKDFSYWSNNLKNVDV